MGFDVDAARRTLAIARDPETISPHDWNAQEDCLAMLEEACAEVERLRASTPCQRCTEMHRRAQALEGIEQHVDALRASHAREVADVRSRTWDKVILWKKRYREGVEMLRAAGIPDQHPGSQWKTGYLDVLVGRAIEEIASSRTRIARLRAALEFYADPEAYNFINERVVDDEGQRARAALKEDET